MGLLETKTLRLCKSYLLALALTFVIASPQNARAAPQVPMNRGSRDAEPPSAPQTATPPANNTPLTQPAALSGAEDKSYLSYSLTFRLKGNLS
jgi:hypothetical protein